MNQKLIYVAAVLLMIAFMSGCQQKDFTANEHSYLDSPENVSIHVTFKEPVGIDYLTELARNNSLLLAYIEHSFTLLGEQNTAFIEANEKESQQEFENRAKEEFKAFLADITESSPDSETNVDAPSLDIDASETQRIEIVGAVFLGNDADIQNLKETDLIDEADDFIPDEGLRSAQSVSRWAPYVGVINVKPSSRRNQRYIHQYMRWNDVTGFSTRSTYEHDFILNNYSKSSLGPGTYLSAKQYSNGMPRVSYWTSNLPKSYLDTRFGDPSYHKAFTIGSAKASDIRKNKWYYSYIRADNGSATRDNAQLELQLGERSPSSCYSTWCAWGRETHDVSKGWNLPIPLDHYYWYR